MEKVNFLEHENDIVGWLITECMVASKKDTEIAEKIKFSKENSPKKEAIVTLSLSINGIEVPVVKVLKSVENQLDRMVKDEAKELISDRCYKQSELLEEFEHRLKNLLHIKDLHVDSYISKDMPNDLKTVLERIIDDLLGGGLYLEKCISPAFLEALIRKCTDEKNANNS